MRAEVVKSLKAILPAELAEALVEDYLKIRRDLAAGTLERAAPGKFVESLVQALQHLETGRYDSKPSVDSDLRNLESRATPFHDGLRICAARIGRAIYTLRNKRNILHKGDVDPNRHDLGFIHAGAQWILAELVRTATGKTMEEAGGLVAKIQAPVGGLVEDFEFRKLVLADISVREEILVLLHSHYPDVLLVSDLLRSMDRRFEKTVKNRLRELWGSKHVEGDMETGFRLTQRGLAAAAEVIARHTSS